MAALHTEFTVNRQEVFRFHQVKHQFQLFLATVTRYVNTTVCTAVMHIGTQTEQFINRTADIFLITWNWCCCDNDCITWQNIHLTVS
ncbi:hypothetical protein D3C76_1634870 [compost metagenome]